MRVVLALLVIAAAIYAGIALVPHHASENSNAFIALYSHLMPARLVAPEGAHGEPASHETHGERPHYLVSITLPGAPRIFDMDLDEHNGTQLVATNLQIFQIAAALLVIICLSGVASHVRNGRGDWLSRHFTGFAMWIRDEMVYPAMGRETGRKFLPFFLTLFFFVVFMNLLGMVPGGATATATIWVTAALATITFLSMIISGMVAQGPIAFWKHLVPHVPLVLWPLMFVVEVVGLCVKPFALTIRLFANMTGGHMVVLSFMALIFFFAGNQHSAMGWAASPVAVAFAVFIMIIESFVALLQAYIFTQLSILFVSASIHPEH